jgi:predicted amidohydrolase
LAATFRLAVAQAPADLDGPEARLGWLQGVLPDVAAAGADLVLLPELFACGYNIGEAVQRRAEAADGPTAQAIAELARTTGLAIHYGYAERAEGRIYNSALCIGPDGAVLGHQRKLAIPPGAERTHFTPGRGCQLFDYRSLRIATLICYDAEFPETVRHVAALGAELVLVPTALGAEWSWVARTMIPTRAYENGVYLAYANSAGVESGFAFLGGSVVVAPDGVEVARAGAKPEVIHADLDKERIKQAQARLPYLIDRSSIELRL